MSFTGKPALTDDVTITNDGFFPELSVGEFLRTYRIPTEYPNDTIAYGVKTALLAINSSLQAVKSELINQGYDLFSATYELAFIPGSTVWDNGETEWDAPNPPNLNTETIGGDPRFLFLYKKAVFSYAKGYLLQQFNSMNRRKDAENVAKESPETYQFWLDEAQNAVYDLVKQFLPDSNITANHGVYVALI